MTWDVEYTDRFGSWWDSLSAAEQESVFAVVTQLQERGPQLAYPYSSAILRSRHPHMRELRIQHKGEPYRVLYAFDPRRSAILLIGGNKAGDERWYERMIPLADRIYDVYLEELRTEGLI